MQKESKTLVHTYGKSDGNAENLTAMHGENKAKYWCRIDLGLLHKGACTAKTIHSDNLGHLLQNKEEENIAANMIWKNICSPPYIWPPVRPLICTLLPYTPLPI